MSIISAEFIKSCSSLKECPPEGMPEYAFIGRSNVGKSSLINMLVGRRNLATTSSKPGKTRLINYFLINSQWYLVDLPGYGFARQSKGTREQWERMIRTFLKERKSLVSIFHLIDIRIDPQESDLKFAEWMALNHLPFVMLFTKADKLSNTARENSLRKWAGVLIRDWQELPPAIITSSKTKLGHDDVMAWINSGNSQFHVRD